TKRAKDGSCPLCTRTVETFAGIFGSVAGDLVLTLGAWDGVYLTGGLIPVLLPWLERGRFRERFEAKGRFRDIMEKVPTQAIMNPEPGLLGAAAPARQSPAATGVQPAENTMPRRDTAFLFDLDGTLIDSVYQHVLAWKEALDAEGLDI